MSIEKILDGMPLDDDAKARVTESWQAALKDAKIAMEAQIRAEFTERYEADLGKIHNSFGIFLEERIKPHVEELQEGVAQVDAMKSRYAEKTAKIKEAAQAHVRKKLAAVEAAVEANIRKELDELHEDVVANRRAVLQSITEKRAELERERQTFRTKAGSVLENIINVKLPKQLDELREDIQAARQDNFGREVFEAFTTTFRSQFFNSSAEFKKLGERIATLESENKKIKVKAARAVKESQDRAAAEATARKKLQESVTRGQIMARLLKPLSGTARVQMKTLLEATKTNKLETTFKKALPQIVKENRKPKSTKSARKLNEGKSNVRQVEFRSGGTAPLTEEAYDQFEDEVSDIRRLAGNAS